MTGGVGNHAGSPNFLCGKEQGRVEGGWEGAEETSMNQTWLAGQCPIDGVSGDFS